MGVYVDDLIICGLDSKKIIEFKQQMMSLFSMSDLGLLSYYLGITIPQPIYSVGQRSLKHNISIQQLVSINL